MAKIAEATLGARFGKLTVTGERIPTRQATVPVRCDCGTEKVAFVHQLGVQVNSCGQCLRAPVHHGKSRTPEYRAWMRMIQRCTNPNNSNWSRYGGRGISVAACFRHDFEAFLREIGPRPTPSHSVDRIDNDRGYEPGNVRWATPSEQALNRSPRTLCCRGHHLDGDNVRTTRKGSRACRECDRLRGAEARAKRRSFQEQT
ncbi:hypothetical protein ABT160_02570 [Streptomyces sp. NPDC001941]|uniref:hypothetical protein n=1 Tax=Streptomyces sp. NPDC001941 TaxID=3154659 RepID=UPI003333504F